MDAMGLGPDPRRSPDARITRHETEAVVERVAVNIEAVIRAPLSVALGKSDIASWTRPCLCRSGRTRATSERATPELMLMSAARRPSRRRQRKGGQFGSEPEVKKYKK